MTRASECQSLDDHMTSDTGHHAFAATHGGDRSILLSQDQNAIRRHPRSAAARNIAIARLVALGQASPLHRRVLLEEGRCMILLLILAMHVTRDPAECATWPTLRR